jgi:hypothetical protein
MCGGQYGYIMFSKFGLHTSRYSCVVRTGCVGVAAIHADLCNSSPVICADTFSYSPVWLHVVRLWREIGRELPRQALHLCRMEIHATLSTIVGALSQSSRSTHKMLSIPRHAPAHLRRLTSLPWSQPSTGQLEEGGSKLKQQHMWVAVFVHKDHGIYRPS